MGVQPFISKYLKTYMYIAYVYEKQPFLKLTYYPTHVLYIAVHGKSKFYNTVNNTDANTDR